MSGRCRASDVLCCRDYLRLQRKSAATVAFKLVVRSFFEHPRAAGAVSSTRMRQGWCFRPRCRRSPRGDR